MHRRKRISHTSPQKPERKEVRYLSDYQLNWVSLIPQLKNYELKRVDFLSIPGDAPKDFIRDAEYRQGHRSRKQRLERYIAKVGSKFYPNESIVEQLLTRVGQNFRVNIAESKLRIIDGQVRFLSKYFLDRHNEQLIHGAQIFEQCLGKEEYAELAEKKNESEYFTFQMVCEAIRVSFPEFEENLVKGLVEMLAFDCLIGHNDRHPYNWGVIVPIYKQQSPRFSPVFDTARALFWNVPESRVKQMLRDRRQLETYIARCASPFSWDGEPTVDFFRLIGLIWEHFDKYKPHIEKFLKEAELQQTLRTIEKEFSSMMSSERLLLVQECLRLRHEKLKAAIGD
ncbi:MAG: HipA domain-containing protein [Acidobacteriota bacterium]